MEYLMDLNPQQKSAVTHKEGPLLIVAGPGSGKTHVIIERVKNLVQSQIPQSAILCLTFTEKAAGEMKQRLERHGIIDAKISTFHSFAREVLEENMLASGLGHATKILKKPVQMVWCIKNTDRFNFDPRYVNLKNNHVRVYTGMLEAISNFKEEMITPEQFQQYIDTRLAELEKTVTTQETKEDLEKERQYLLEHNEFNKVYREYEKFRDIKQLIDFDDMVSLCVHLLKDNPRILKQYREKFQHILVDEFQDNNFAQLEIVKLLSEQKNITVVGDDDQCIMRFQGAYFGIFEDFEKHYSDKTKVELGQNYRSTQNIVELSSQLLSDVPDRLPKNLFAKQERGDPVNVVRCSTNDAQTEYVVEKIRSLIGKPITRRNGTTDKITYSDIAVLSRRRAEGSKIATALKSFGIPTTFVGDTNIFTTAVIRDMVAFLKTTSSPSTSGMHLFHIMKSSGISEKNIAVITNKAHVINRHVYEGEEDSVLDMMRKADTFDISQKSEIAELVLQIDKSAKAHQQSTIPELVHKIMMSISGIYKKFVQSDSSNSRKNLAYLNKFYELSLEFYEIFPEKSLAEFIEHLEILGKIEIEIEDTTAYEDTVSVMTLHKSKGKEFPIVFVTDLSEGKLPSKYLERHFHVPEKLLKGIRQIDTKEMHIQEERRLMYVGMTRAQNQLFLLSPILYSGTVTKRKPSVFLDELDFENNPLVNATEFEASGKFQMGSEDLTERIKQELQNETASAVNSMNLTTAVHRIIELSRVKYFEENGTFDGFDAGQVIQVDLNDVNHRKDLEGQKEPLINKETFTLSPSSYKAYVSCPLKFKFQKILRVPTKSSPALDLGTAIHGVAEDIANEKAEGKQISEKQALTKLQDRWIFRSFQNKDEESKSLDRAKTMVKKYIEWEQASKNTLVGTEIAFDVKIGDVTFTGRIDRLEKNPDGKYEVIDFKSGSSKLSKNKAALDPQLNIYALAVRKMYGELPVKASLHYLENNPVDYFVTEESVDDAIGPILMMTGEILAENFDPAPSHDACMFCPYTAICSAKVTLD